MEARPSRRDVPGPHGATVRSDDGADNGQAHAQFVCLSCADRLLLMLGGSIGALNFRVKEGVCRPVASPQRAERAGLTGTGRNPCGGARHSATQHPGSIVQVWEVVIFSGLHPGLRDGAVAPRPW